jgi:hypothetical protein
MRIRLAENFRAIFYAPFYASRALGFHADEGVEVEWLAAATPGEGVAGFARRHSRSDLGRKHLKMRAAPRHRHSPVVEVLRSTPACSNSFRTRQEGFAVDASLKVPLLPRFHIRD